MARGWLAVLAVLATLAVAWAGPGPIGAPVVTSNVVGDSIAPARLLANELGWRLSWDGEQRIATLVRPQPAPGVTLRLRVERRWAERNGESFVPEIGARLSNGRLYVPLGLLLRAGLLDGCEESFAGRQVDMVSGDRRLALAADNRFRPVVIGGATLGALDGHRWLGRDEALAKWTEPVRYWYLWDRHGKLGERRLAAKPEKGLGEDLYVDGLMAGDRWPPPLASPALFSPIVAQQVPTTLVKAGLVGAVNRLLEAHALKPKRAPQGEAIACDLDRDGAPEWVLAIADYGESYPFGDGQTGDASVLAVLPSGARELTVLTGQFVTAPRRVDGIVWRLLGCWDLDGDGSAEVVGAWGDEAGQLHTQVWAGGVPSAR